jgi:uncharacterized protein YajQ (UPF0234 family)
MPSFDIESNVDLHELTNAIDQSNRVIANRYDFKEANASFEFANETVKLMPKKFFRLIK